MDKKTTRGRQKIPIQKITEDADRFATFSKRRLGLYKKASEICTLCDVDIGIILFSPTGKPFSFFHPTMESVLNPFQTQHVEDSDVSRLSEAFARNRISMFNHNYNEISEQLEAEKKNEKQVAVNRAGHTKYWWDMPVADMTKEQIENLLIMLQNLKMHIKNREEELKTHASTSSMFMGQYHQNTTTVPMGFNPLTFETMGVVHLPQYTSLSTTHGFYNPHGLETNGEGSSQNQNRYFSNI